MPIRINGEEIRFSSLPRTSKQPASRRAPPPAEQPPRGPNGEPLRSGSVPGLEADAADVPSIVDELTRSGGVYISHDERLRRWREGDT